MTTQNAQVVGQGTMFATVVNYKAVNAKTKESYTGANALTLSDVSEEVATFLQWKELGYKVKKGAKGIELHKVGEYSKINEKTKKVEGANYLKRFWVFKASDVEKI